MGLIGQERTILETEYEFQSQAASRTFTGFERLDVGSRVFAY
jgi:hypothetical protein